MSAQNVESSERGWDRFVGGDISGMLEFLDPEVEIREPPQLPGASVYRGHAGWRTQLEKFAEAFTDIAYERLETIDCGDDVVAVIRATGSATSSGIEAAATYAQVETWRAGRIVSIRYFMTRSGALEAVGLEE